LPVPHPGDPHIAAELAGMLAKPEFLTDPVFPKDDYLRSFATGFFRHILRQSNELELIGRIQVLKPHLQMATLRADHLGFWAIDLDVEWRGVSGREEFVSVLNAIVYEHRSFRSLAPGPTPASGFGPAACRRPPPPFGQATKGDR